MGDYAPFASRANIKRIIPIWIMVSLVRTFRS